MRMRKRRILPATCPRTVWPLSSWTRNMALGSASTTSPSNSTFSSFATRAGRYSTARTRATALAAARRVHLGLGLRRRLVEVGVVALELLALLLAVAVAVAVAGRRARRGGRRRRSRSGLHAVGVLAALRHVGVGAGSA